MIHGHLRLIDMSVVRRCALGDWTPCIADDLYLNSPYVSIMPALPALISSVMYLFAVSIPRHPFCIHTFTLTSHNPIAPPIAPVHLPHLLGVL